MRYANFDNTLTFGGVQTDSSQDFVDPMVVARPNVPINDWIMFNPTIAIGGGGDSDFIYELQPQLHFQFTDLLAARVGYRRLYYKVTGDGERGNEFDGAFHGLIVGVSFTF